MKRKYFARGRRLSSSLQLGQRLRFRPGLEALEDRTLLSVTSTIFTLDPPQSLLTLSGTVSGRNIEAQGPGALTTSYRGTVASEWDLDPAGPNMKFVSAGSAAIANNSGAWQPNVGGGAGSAAANYGGRVQFNISFCSVTARIAVRDLVVSASNPSPVPLIPSGEEPYTFPSSQTLRIDSGFADYNYSAGICGSGSGRQNIGGQSVTNQASARGAFRDQGDGQYSLIIPISVTINETISTPLGNIPVVLRINGSMQANASIPVVSLDGVTGDYETTAVAGGDPVNIADPANAKVMRTPSANLTSMTLTLTNRPDGEAEFLFVDQAVLDKAGLTSSGYDPATGELTISGNNAPSAYELVLRAVYYQNLVGADLSDRFIQVVARDGTNPSVVRNSIVHIAVGARLQQAGTLRETFSPSTLANLDWPNILRTVAVARSSMVQRAVAPGVLHDYEQPGPVQEPSGAFTHFNRQNALLTVALELVKGEHTPHDGNLLVTVAAIEALALQPFTDQG